MQNKNNVWFSNIEKKNTLEEKDLNILEKIIASSIKSNKLNPNNETINDTHPRILFLSIAEFGITATVFHGQGFGILSAFESAFQKMQQRFDCSDKKYKVKIDIVKSSRIQKDCNKKSAYKFNIGLDGIAFEKEFDLALLPDQISYNNLWYEDKTISTNRVFNFLEKNPSETQKFANLLRREKFDAYIFKTSGYLLENEKLVPLYRGQRLFNQYSLSYLKESTKMGGEYLVNSIMPSGRYEYIYHIDLNRHQRDYNFLRHAGSCFSLAEYFEFSQDKSCLPALKRALKYMKLFAAPGLEDPNTICFIERGLVKIGGNGLAALALAKYMQVTGDDSEKEFLSKICNWILTQIQDNGDFKGHKQYYHDGTYSDKKVLYYPGEVIYGLVMSYHLIGEMKWIDAANKIAGWMINTRDNNIETTKLAHDHWLLYGLNELYRVTPKQEYIDHTSKICESIMNRQIIESRHPDYYGGHNNYSYPTSTQAAIRSEGMIAAHKLLRDYGKMPDFADKVLHSAKRGIAFQLRTQYTDLTTMYVHNPHKALGGFRRDLNSHETRIDYVQHNIASFMNLYNVLKQTDGK